MLFFFINITFQSSINSKEGGWKEKKNSKPKEITHKPPGPSSSWERGFNGDKINLDSSDHSTSFRTWAKVGNLSTSERKTPNDLPSIGLNLNLGLLLCKRTMLLAMYKSM